MKTPAHVVDIFLQPGEWYFGDRDTRIRTVLGSCVSLTAWHPKLKIGCMCHYMLPSRGKNKALTLDGRYADEALALLAREMRAAGTEPREYQIKLFGGGHMFSGQVCLKNQSHVSYRNTEAARALTAQYGLSIAAENMGGVGHRNIIFDVWSGDVWVKHHQGATPDQCGRCDVRQQCGLR